MGSSSYPEISADFISDLFALAFKLEAKPLFYKAALAILESDPDAVFWLTDRGFDLLHESNPTRFHELFGTCDVPCTNLYLL